MTADETEKARLKANASLQVREDAKAKIHIVYWQSQIKILRSSALLESEETRKRVGFAICRRIQPCTRTLTNCEQRENDKEEVMMTWMICLQLKKLESLYSRQERYICFKNTLPLEEILCTMRIN
jgi:hypothetical protein